MRTHQMMASMHMQDLEGEGLQEVVRGACEVGVEGMVGLATNMGTHCRHRLLLAQPLRR